MINKKLIIPSVITLLALPVAVLAAINFNPPSGNAVVQPAVVVVAILNFIWPIIVGITVIMFLVAGIMFMSAQGEPGKLQAARSMVIYGIVGIIVTLLAFSIIGIVQLGTGIF